MQNEVLDFIQRRFKDDCRWIDGNCYYFAIILKDRFPEGKIFYDTIWGHFVFFYKNEIYDWNGIRYNCGFLVKWDDFDKYDRLQKQRIVQDCLL